MRSVRVLVSVEGGHMCALARVELRGQLVGDSSWWQVFLPTKVFCLFVFG